MNRIDETALAAYLDRWMQAKGRLLDQRFFRATVTGVSVATQGPFLCTLAPATTPTMTLQALAPNPGYTPLVGDDVECVWRDLNTAYVLWPVNSAPGGNPYRARIYMSSAQSIANSTWTPLAFDTMDYGPGSMIATGSSAHFTVPFTGTYDVRAGWGFGSGPSNGAGLLDVARGVSSGYTGTNGTRLTAAFALAASGQVLAGSTILNCSANDTLYFWVWQSTGGTVACQSGNAPVITRAEIRYLGQ